MNALRQPWWPPTRRAFSQQTEYGEMETILKDINAVVGVTGSFVCDDEGRIMARLMPGIFDENLLSPVARTIAQTIAGLKVARRRKVGDVDLLYDHGRLVIKSLE